MRIPVALALLIGASLLVACSSDDTGPAADNSNLGSFGPATQGYDPVQAQPPIAAAPASFTWHTRLADAQAEARRTGRLILCMSTNTGCTLCDKFKNEIVPQTRAQVAPMAVGYVYQIRRPEVPQVDQTLRANLKGASLMPLVGFLTPELRWVHGFWGPTDARKFSGDIQQARRIYPVQAARIEPPQMPGRSGMTAVVNEFGEREWSLPGDVWPTEAPEPEDAITGRPMPSGALPPAGPGTAPVLADATPAAPAPAPMQPGPASPAPAATDPAPAALPPMDPIAEAPRPDPAPAAAPKPGPSAPSGPATEDWGRETLQRALQQIQIGDYDGARGTLKEIRRRLPNSTIARQAAKGSVAIYNHKRVRTASGVERDQVLARAKRDLGDTMWGVLFSS